MQESGNLIFHPLPESKKFKDLTGLVFGKLTVIGFAGRFSVASGSCVSKWHCLCECGNRTISQAGNLNNGSSKSCGCVCTTHGHTSGGGISPTYKCWSSMNDRMLYPSEETFKNYGGRGITMDSRWREFENFLEDMGERPSNKHSIDRIDNNLGYSKGNCRWATVREQNRNKRSNVNFEINGKMMCMAECSEKFGINLTTLHYRISAGWSVDRALNTPVRAR